MAMKRATQDDITLSEAVEERFKELCGLHFRARGTKLLIPPGLYRAFKLWRQFKMRYAGKTGRVGITISERRAVQEIAQWTVDVKAEICGQDKQVVEFR